MYELLIKYPGEIHWQALLEKFDTFGEAEQREESIREQGVPIGAQFDIRDDDDREVSR